MMNYSDDLQRDALSQGRIEHALDEADNQAASTTIRYTHDEVFESIRGELTNAD